MLTALRHPARVEGLVLVSGAIYADGPPAVLRPFLYTLQMRRLGPLLVRTLGTQGEAILASAWHDPSKVTAEIIAGYRQPLRAENWDRALWELTLASHPLQLDAQLKNVRAPTLVVTGDDDRIVPTAQSIRLAAELPNAELVVIPSCGHVPQEECPQAFLNAVMDYLMALRSAYN
jgi:pimeloyl-ACP methyl ester carboxylesterase